MDRTYVKIDLDALNYNIDNVKRKIGNAKLLAVIKADAYGHGACQIADDIKDKCDFFGVASVDEAVELINHGINNPILILGYVSPEDYQTVVEMNIRIPIFSFECAKALSKEACRQGRTALFHFALDTGMSRIGFLCTDENADICEKIAKLPNIKAEGIFSHLATADEKDLTKAKNQIKLFDEFTAKLQNRGMKLGIKHINNSAGIINFSDSYDMVRCGIITYGLYPSAEVTKDIVDLQPVMSWYSVVTCIKELEKGAEVSYGGTFKIEKKTKVAVIAVGYADGYPRCLSNRGHVIINGKFAPILGRVCMDQIIVDISDIPDVNIETKVTLVGIDGNCSISMEDIANAAHSFNYEQSCRVSRRVPRIYYKNSKIVQKVNYLN